MIIKCPECRKPVSTMAGTCPQCGVQIAGKLIECPKCHEYNLTSHKECISCHTPLDTPEIETAEKEESPQKPTRQPAARKKKGHGCAWFFLTLALIASVVGAFFVWQEKQKEEKEFSDYTLLNDVTNPMFYEQFLTDYPESKYKDDVIRRKQKLEAEAAEWEEVLKNKSRIQLFKFMQSHPRTHHRRECEDLIDSIDWNDAMQIGTHEAVADYLQNHPSGQYAEIAAGKLNELAKSRITHEEKVQILGMMNTFFSNGLARQDTSFIAASIVEMNCEFCGTRQATATQIAEYNKERLTSDVLGIHYVINNNLNIRRETLEDGSLGFALDFIVEETINRSDATQPSHRTLQASVWLTQEKKIIRMHIK